jgi:hypothetical protein
VTHLKTPHVLLDTTVFDAANYSYTAGPLKALADLASADRINVHLSDITLREVKAHISEGVASAVHAQREFEKKARILRNSRNPSVGARFAKVDPHTMEAELLDQLDKFLKKAKVNIISSTGIDLSKVLDDYFEKKPPFGEGKNKSEFPDAFTLSAANTWSEEHKQNLYVVSADSAVKSACKDNGLLPLEKLSSFLDLVAREDEARAQFIHETTHDRFGEIEEQIKKDFERQGFMVSDKEGDVNEVNVTDVELEDINILSFSKDSAEVEMEVRISFEADISYADLDNAIYDNEEGRYVLWDTVEKTVQAEETVTVTATILLNPDKPEYFEFERVHISGQDTYSVKADDEWPYK